MRSQAHTRIRPWLIYGIGAVALGVCSGGAAQACLFSNVASASANGVVARRVASALSSERLAQTRRSMTPRSQAPHLPEYRAEAMRLVQE